MKNYKRKIINQRLKKINNSLTENDFIFKIKSFINNINLLELENNFKQSIRGPKPIPLWVPVCVWVYAYSQGQLVYRKVADLCKTHDHYYWLSGGYEPSEAYLETWKLRILPLMPQLLKQIKALLIDKEIIKNEILGLDGVKVQTWASTSQNKTEEGINKEIDKLTNKLNDTSNIDKKTENKYKRRMNKLNCRKLELQKRKKEYPNNNLKDNMKINITSPDTVILKKRNGKWIQGINLQAIVNQDNIVNVHEPCRSSTDNGLLSLMYDKIATFLKVIILQIYLLADCGYWNYEDIKRFDPQKGYKIIMPDFARVTKERKKKPGKKTDVYDIDKFKYKENEDIYICKSEHKLTFIGTSTNIRKNSKYQRKTYRASVKDCKMCKYNKKCIGNVKNKSKILKVTVYDDQAIERFKDYFNKPENIELYKKRITINEPTHAHIFHNNGIERLHCLNGPQIDGEIALLILIDTLKKVWRHHDPNFLIHIFLFFLYVKRIKIHPRFILV